MRLVRKSAKAAGWQNAAVTGAILILALVMRSNLTYRTAFVDEAISMNCGLEILREGRSSATSMRMGWPILSCTPAGIMSMVGGLTMARGFSALCGVLTVYMVLQSAKNLYGPVAGYLAGLILTISSIAIFVSTFAHSDSLSIMLTSIGFWCWTKGASGEQRSYYPVGSLCLVGAVLVKYAAIVPVAAMAICMSAFLLWDAWRQRTAGSVQPAPAAPIVRISDLALVLAPFALLPLYALGSWHDLAAVWKSQVLSKASSQPGVRLDIVSEYLKFSWIPLTLCLPAVLFHPKRRTSLALFLIGNSMLCYHLLNRDQSTVFKFTAYGLLLFAPLAGASLAMILDRSHHGAQGRIVRYAPTVVGLGMILLFAWLGQRQLPGLRSFWSDSTEVVVFLRERLVSGDVLLYEGGQVAEYYLGVRGEPDRQPGAVYTTWYYADGEGSGAAAMGRGITEQRFDWIVLDHAFTPELNRSLLLIMQDKYRLEAMFPAKRFGSVGAIHVYVPAYQTEMPSSE